MKTYLTGATGQVGSELSKLLDVDTRRFDLAATQISQACEYITKQKFDYVINAAAFTNVDAAEDKGNHRALSCILNAYVPQKLAEACNESNTRLIHISTDYVFDGAKTTPYLETDKAFPRTVYGQHKLEGEELVRANLKQHYILRTSWVYSSIRNNFVKTMLRLGREHPTLHVVDDQVGCPTSAKQIATAICQIVEADQSDFGTYNFTASEPTTWYDFAKAIFTTVAEIDTQYPTPDVIPISTQEYRKPEMASRPPNSVLDCSKIKDTFGISQPTWKSELVEVVSKLIQLEND